MVLVLSSRTYHGESSPDVTKGLEISMMNLILVIPGGERIWVHSRLALYVIQNTAHYKSETADSTHLKADGATMILVESIKHIMSIGAGI